MGKETISRCILRIVIVFEPPTNVYLLDSTFSFSCIFVNNTCNYHYQKVENEQSDICTILHIMIMRLCCELYTAHFRNCWAKILELF